MEKRWFVTILLAAAFVLASCITDPALLPLQPVSVLDEPDVDSTLTEDEADALSVFTTPEAAIRYYLDGIRQNDVEMILAASAVMEMSQGYDFEFAIDRLGSAISFPQFLAPSDAQFYAEMNQFQVSAQILQQVKLLSYRLLAGEIVDDGAAVVELDPEEVTQLIHDLDPARLSTMQVMRVGSPLKTSDEFYKQIAEIQARVYGADEFTERIALVEFEEKLYTVGFSLMRYGDSWKISNQSSPLAEIGPLGIPTETTAESFAGMVLEEQ